MLSKFFESRFFDYIGKIVDIILLGIYFLVCSIPIFTIGASLTALYYSIHKVIYQGRGYTTEFFHSFKDNFKQATLSWLIFLGVGAVLFGDLYITQNMLEEGDTLANFWIIFVIMMVLEIVWALYHFTYMARFENGFKASFKISGALAVINFASSLVIILITAVFALFVYLLPVFLIFVPSLYMLAVHPVFEKIYRSYMSEEDLKLEEERMNPPSPSYINKNKGENKMLEGIEKIELEDSIELFWMKKKGVEEIRLGDKVFKPEKTHILWENLVPDTEYVFEIKTAAGKETLKAKTLKRLERIDVTTAPYNCIGDGASLNTKGLQAAIDACREGQCVYIPQGTFLTGALNLHSNMALYVEKGAILQGTANINDYLPKIHSRFEGTEMECYRSLLNLGCLNRNEGANCSKVLITGGGSILGGGAELAKATIRFERDRLADEIAALGDEIKTYESVDTIPGRTRGRLINMSNCSNITITNLTLGQAASWNLHFIYSNRIVTSRCTFVSEGVWNGDGWDPDSSTDCAIFGCLFHTEDDSVAIKSGKNPEGNEIARPTKNIFIFDNFSQYGHGLCIGSEMSGGVENVHIWDCQMGDSMSGIEIKATKKRGGYVRNVNIENVVTSHVMFHAVGYNDDGIGADHPPVFEDCSFKNLQIYGELYDADHTYKECDAIELIGFNEPGYQVKNIEFENITLGKPGKEGKPLRLTLALCEGISLKNLKCI